MAVTVQFHKGLKEIGGTFVEVETARAKCMFDFGFARGDMLDYKIRPRKGFAASDYAALGILPVTDGIYDARNADVLRVLPYGEPTVSKECFLLISHMHIDHMGGLTFLHPDVPVYMTKDSLKLYKRISENGKEEGAMHKNCIGVEPGIPFTVGDITVTALSVDHDVPGACGFLIRSEGKTICYTGDFRFHGFHKELSRDFARKVSQAGVDMMICEGTSVSHEPVNMLKLTAPEEGKRTEQDLQKEVRAYAKKAEGLIVINCYPRNVERLHQLVETLKKCGRKLVLVEVAADYLNAFYPKDPICVYEDTMLRADRPKKWRRVSRQELLFDPSQYVLQLPYRNMYELVALRGGVSAYLHFDGAPLGAYDPSFRRMEMMLEELGIAYEHMGVSGHAEPYYIKYMIDTIAPKILVPLHSFKPEQVKSDAAERRILPAEGEVVKL
ncbi:MAG: hypothetical protein IJR58_04780 [Lachnospiraceae bacterium]|nr:hypothetical protein [Lachnospiraceae bacterium]